jgi:proteasome lid subunit RPN8/RPN11
VDPFRLVIPPAVRDAMLAHAHVEMPNECIGFLAGTIADGVGTVSLCLPLINELQSPTEFLTEPRSVFEAYRTLRATGTDLLAIYHSHPTSPPVPSQKDIAKNTYGPTVVWIIIGLSGAEPEVRAWWLTETGCREMIL